HAALSEVLPGIVVFGVGLSFTVSPLTAAILGDIDQRQAGIGSAINNAIARVAGLLAVATGDGGLDAPTRAFVAAARARPLDTSVPERLGRDAPPVKALLEGASIGAL